MEQDEFQPGARVRFKGSHLDHEYTVLRSFRNAAQSYVYDLEGPQRNQWGVPHKRLELAAKKQAIDLGEGDLVRFARTTRDAAFVVAEVHSNGTVDVQGPKRIRRGIDPKRLILIKRLGE